MTLSEWFEQNKDVEIELKDGKIELKSKCPLKYGDCYFFVGYDGDVLEDSWADTGTDRDRWDQGRAYKTEEEAKKAIEIVTETLLKFRDDHDMTSNNDQPLIEALYSEIEELEDFRDEFDREEIDE